LLQDDHTTIFADNQGPITLAKNPENHARTKHVDIKYHYIRQEVSAGIVALQYISTGDMLADVLVKSVTRVKIEVFHLSVELVETKEAADGAGSRECNQ
jgi:hypothetical protein